MRGSSPPPWPRAPTFTSVLHRAAPSPPSTPPATLKAKSPRRSATDVSTGSGTNSSSTTATPTSDAEPWLEPRSPREEAIALKLVRTQQALQKAKADLRRRDQAEKEQHVPGAAVGEPPGKQDWSLALRYRLTAELRAELATVEGKWEADRQKYASELDKLREALSQATREKEATVARLMQEVLELQRLYSEAVAQRETTQDALQSEVTTAERSSDDRVGALERELEAARFALADQAAEHKRETLRLQAALNGVCEDLEQERKGRGHMEALLQGEIRKLRADVERLTSDLGHSQAMHAHDVAQLRGAKAAAEAQLEAETGSLKRQVAAMRADKERIHTELTERLHRSEEKRDASEAELLARLEHVERKHRAEAAALRVRISELRQVQKIALEHSTGKMRQVLLLETMKQPGKRDSDYWRGDDPTPRSPPTRPPHWAIVDSAAASAAATPSPPPSQFRPPATRSPAGKSTPSPAAVQERDHDSPRSVLRLSAPPPPVILSERAADGVHFVPPPGL